MYSTLEKYSRQNSGSLSCRGTNRYTILLSLMSSCTAAIAADVKSSKEKSLCGITYDSLAIDRNSAVASSEMARIAFRAMSLGSAGISSLRRRGVGSTFNEPGIHTDEPGQRTLCACGSERTIRAARPPDRPPRR
eukprot:699544-Prymnesium_polylepis.1